MGLPQENRLCQRGLFGGCRASPNEEFSQLRAFLPGALAIDVRRHYSAWFGNKESELFVYLNVVEDRDVDM
jgi:hypothetical protein